MIISFEELAGHRGRVAMVDGGFDPLHAGHIGYFRAAKELGLPVLCSVTSDAYVSRKHKPLLPHDQRARIIDALRDIDYTHVNERRTVDVLAELKPKYYVKGKDWEGRLPAEELAVCKEHGIEVVYLDTVTDSSSRILERYMAR